MTMPIKDDITYTISRFGNDWTAAVEQSLDGRPAGIILSNTGGLGWNLLDAEVFVFASIKLAEAEGLAWAVRHWMGNAQWRERKAVYQEIYDRLNLVEATDISDVWDLGEKIYEDLRTSAR